MRRLENVDNGNRVVGEAREVCRICLKLCDLTDLTRGLKIS